MNPHHTIIDAYAYHNGDPRLDFYAQNMFDLYASFGLPPDMFLKNLAELVDLTDLAKVYIVSQFQHRFLEHRRKSGVQDKNLAKLRRRNLEDITRLIQTGELGVY